MIAFPWRAWYADGRVFDHGTCQIAQLPAEGLVCVVEYLDDHYKNIYHGEFIWHRAGEWGTAMTGRECPPGARVWPGVQMPDAQWERVHNEALGANNAKNERTEYQ